MFWLGVLVTLVVIGVGVALFPLVWLLCGGQLGR
jgi:hypothetical protein